jgi:hypothetical protein
MKDRARRFAMTNATAFPDTQLNFGLFITVMAILIVGLATPLFAQSPPPATQQAALEVFATATGTHTGLGSGRNIGITAGVDLAIHRSQSFVPAVEIRGTWPFSSGDTDSFHDLMAGLKFSRAWRRYQIYGDGLFGRAQIEYEHGGLPNPSHTFLYTKSPSNILSLGGGLEVPLTWSLGVKADLQWQRYSSPVASSGHLNAIPVSVGVVYRFGGR